MTLVKNHVVILIHYYTVAPAITSVPGDQILYAGDDYTLRCVVTGFPTPVISYYFNVTLITNGVSDGALTLTSVTAANTGPYQCFADNVRADSSALWIIRVREPGESVLCVSVILVCAMDKIVLCMYHHSLVNL